MCYVYSNKRCGRCAVSVTLPALSCPSRPYGIGLQEMSLFKRRRTMLCSLHVPQTHVQRYCHLSKVLSLGSPHVGYFNKTTVLTSTFAVPLPLMRCSRKWAELGRVCESLGLTQITIIAALALAHHFIPPYTFVAHEQLMRDDVRIGIAPRLI
jgi:hypothetical protein